MPSQIKSMEETQTPPTLAKQIFFYPITRILVGLMVIIGALALFQFSTSWLLKLAHVADDARKTILSIEAPLVVLVAYTLLYKYYEKPMTNLREKAKV